MAGCCGQAKPKQDYLITYKSGRTERVAADQGLITVRQKIIKGGGGTFRMVPKQ
ncbi:hypothetical protein [Streptomyces drozdowiczii]|uniref:hypothetical protein n=1 Tax=Streptomyces drozdowiczii TaxID=202862 RepID=UPI002247906D|nr:hypothetical protein [Streptomyces drozdowiczii]MCX0246416.1 hypothetical protein [Streptomyces drozdowiczii]